MVGSMAGPVSADDLATLQRAGVATTVESLGVPQGYYQMMSPEMVRRTSQLCIAGQAVTVANGHNDNLMMHVALEVAGSGQVLVITGTGPMGVSWGEMVTVGAMAKGIVGVIVDGSARDVDGVNRLGFPVWATSVRPFGAGKEAIGSVGRPVMRAGVNVSPGDVVVVAAAASVRTEREVGLRLAAEGGAMPGRVAGHLDGIDFDIGSG
jgi:4-hydroxy-4-methyl-2-oxoglutarate aldolase